MNNSSMLGGIFRKRTDVSNGVSVQKSATNGDAESSNATADSPSTGTRLSKEKAAAASTQLSAAFGKITAVLMRAPMYRQMHLSDLEWLVAPAVATRQFLIAELQNKTNGLTVPVSAVLWARVSDDVDQRLTSNAGQAIRLRPEEWNSGSIPWLIAAAGEPRTVTDLIRTVAEKQFGNAGIKAISKGPDGKPVVSVLHTATAAATPGATRPS